MKTFLFDDEKDPYQLNNLPIEENRDIVKGLCVELGAELKKIDDPWYIQKVLTDLIKY